MSYSARSDSDFFDTDWRDRALSLERGWVLTAAITSILFGLFVILRPSAGLVTVSIIFGTYLVVAGVSRVAFSIAGKGRSTLYRWVMAILGVLIIVAGFLCLIDVVTSLQTLAIVLGVGLVIAGIADLALLGNPDDGRPTWVRVTGAVLSIIAGILMFVVPFISVGLIVIIGAIALIVVGLAGLVAASRFSSAPASPLSA